MNRLDQLRAYLVDKPEDRFALYGVALELKKAGDLEEARGAFEALLRAHPTSGAGHYQHGLLFFEHEDESAARIAWEAGLIALQGESDPEARRSRSEIQGALDDLD